VTNKVMTYTGILLATGFLFTSSANAFNMNRMMNPTKWFKGSGSDDYYDGPYGPPPPGYGYGGPGYGYGGPGYGGPGYGYGGPGFGYGAPGYGGPPPGYGAAPQQQAPQMGGEADAGEIARLKERIRQLEDANREIPPPSSSYGQPSYQGSTPAYGAQPGGYQQAPAYGSQPGYEGGPPSYGGSQPGYQQTPPSYGQPTPQFRPLNTD
jgi:hypothetical protein